MPNSVYSIMAEALDDETFKITDKNFEKVTGKLEKAGYMDGADDGRTSVFQNSFDKGYEDGFRIGFVLGKAEKEKSSRGNCAICAEPSLLKKPEEEDREIHRKQFEKETTNWI